MLSLEELKNIRNSLTSMWGACDWEGLYIPEGTSRAIYTVNREIELLEGNENASEGQEEHSESRTTDH